MSMDGNDAASGDYNSPFATIQYAVDQLKTGDTLYIRGGSYHESVVVNGIKGTKSDPSSRTTIRNYQDEVVMLDGTVVISGDWELVSDNIYRTTLDEDIWQLFVDDKMMTSARWPDAEAWTAGFWDKDTNWIQQDGLSSDGKFIDASGGPDLAGSNKDFSGAIAIMNVGSWLSFARKVVNHGSGNSSFSYDPIGNQYHHKKENGSAFFEAAYACLSVNKEWYYDPSSKQLFLITDNGSSPKGRSVRGKTITYGLEVGASSCITVQGIDFFACTFNVEASDSIVIRDCNVKFPSYSKRMLGYTEKAQPTSVDGNHNMVSNCTFKYADGTGIKFSGDQGVLENNLFYQVDYSCVGSLHDAMVNIRDASNMTFSHNTLDTGGNSVGIKAGSSNIIEYNRVTNQGMLQHDGSAIQADHNFTNGTVMQRNWVHDHIKFAFRFDSPWNKPSIFGTDGIMRYNVLWNARPMVPKGDMHHIYNNTAFGNDTVDISIFSDINHGGINSKTATINNAVNLISGSRSASIQYPGTKKNNWVGKSFAPNKNVKAQLVATEQWDFRPTLGSELIDAGASIPDYPHKIVGAAPDIGAYEFGDTNYWIPGHQSAQASMPIPKSESVNQPQGRELIFLPGYKGISANIYYGKSEALMALLAKTSVRANIINPQKYGVTPLENTKYYWRVDTVLEDNSVITGNIWNYTTGSFTPLESLVIFSDNFEIYSTATSPIRSNWSTQVTLGEGTIQIDNFSGNKAVRLYNASTKKDRTVLGAADIFDGQDVITLSFDSFNDNATQIVGNLGVSVGVGNVASHLNQVRKVSLRPHIKADIWHHFDWIVNQSGAIVEYMVYGRSHSIAIGSADLWCDGILVVDNGNDKPVKDYQHGDATLIDSFGWTVNKAESADWRIDNVVIRDSPYVLSALAGDTSHPVITLKGDSIATIEAGTLYVDAGVQANDAVDGDLSEAIKVSGEVDSNKPGSYELKYDVKDSSGNEAVTVTRTVIVVDTISPVITLVGEAIVTVEVGSDYEDPGVAANDSVDGDLTSQIKVTGEVDVNKLGDYELKYSVSDAAGNATEKVRRVLVGDTGRPTITLKGESKVTLEGGSEYSDQGATATDVGDGDLSDAIKVTGEVNANKPGNYELKYDVKDSSGNEAVTITRTVVVVDTTSPVITLVGEAVVTVEVGSDYEDPGVAAKDSVDGDLTSKVKVTGKVDVQKVGEYQLKYNVADASGNKSVELTRRVIVETVIIETIRIEKYNSVPFWFKFKSKKEKSYAIESSTDLREWKQINVIKGTGAIVRFEDERDQVFLQIYFRVRIID